MPTVIYAAVLEVPGCDNKEAAQTKLFAHKTIKSRLLDTYRSTYYVDAAQERVYVLCVATGSPESCTFFQAGRGGLADQIKTIPGGRAWWKRCKQSQCGNKHCRRDHPAFRSEADMLRHLPRSAELDVGDEAAAAGAAAREAAGATDGGRGGGRGGAAGHGSWPPSDAGVAPPGGAAAEQQA